MQTFSQYFEAQEGKPLPKKTYSYSSVLYLLPDKIAKKVYNWGLKHLPDEDLFHDPEDSTLGRENEMHCTVLYGIHDKRSTGCRKILKQTSPFEIKLGKISAFTSSDKYDVLKVEVIGQKLHDLHNELKDNLEVTESYPDYKPHITIGYVKKGKAKQYVGSDVFKNVTMLVEEVVFSSTVGVKTTISLTK